MFFTTDYEQANSQVLGKTGRVTGTDYILFFQQIIVNAPMVSFQSWGNSDLFSRYKIAFARAVWF